MSILNFQNTFPFSKLKYFNDLQGACFVSVIKRNGWWDELTKHLIRQISKPYTKEEVLEDALRYQTRDEFRTQSPGQYKSAKRLGVMGEAVNHMGKSKNVKQYTKKEILESALKYKNQKDWLINEPSVFNSARNYGLPNKSDEDKEFWLSCVSHMDYIFKPNGYWTYERCKEITKNYLIYSEFFKDHPNIYSVIRKNKWFDLTDHMERITKNGNVRQFIKNFETIDKCIEESLKYKTRSEMCKKSNRVYSFIHENKWEKICFSHMVKQVSLKERFIYVCEFNNTSPKYAYVGLTCQVDRRKSAHLYGTDKGKSSVFEKIKEINVIPEFKILTPTPIKESESSEMESMWIEKYKSMGYELLNKVRAGSLGGMRPKFTYDYFMKMKEGCETREEYSKKMTSWVKRIAVKNGWWEELILDMVKIKKMTGEWNMSDALEEVRNYKTLSQLKKENPVLYKFLSKNNMLKVVFPKTVNELKFEKYNDKEECRKESLKYSTKSEFSLKSNSYYRYSIKNGWIDEICSHMVKIKTIIKSKWTYNLIKERANECRNRTEFRKKYRGAFNVSEKLGYIDKFFPK